MTSLRHNHPEPEIRNATSPTPGREAREAYLDAARDCILDVGWRRTTLTEVARRAGVSRMTIYRTWADMPTLLGDLMTREWSGVVTASLAGELAPEDATAEQSDVPVLDRLVATVVGAVRALRENELFVRIIEIDPELVLPYLFARRGRLQDLILALTTEAVTAGQASGEIRLGNPVALARGLLLAAHGFALSAHTMVDDGATFAEIDAELTTLLTRGLTP